jgi:hypothetical protein
MYKHRFGVQLLQNPPLCSSTTIWPLWTCDGFCVGVDIVEKIGFYGGLENLFTGIYFKNVSGAHTVFTRAQDN